MPTIQPERRQAIWPWLVMPLVALTLFYYLEQLKRAYLPENDYGAAPTAAHQSLGTETP